MVQENDQSSVLAAETREKLSLTYLGRLVKNSYRTLGEVWKDNKLRFIATWTIAVITGVFPLIDAKLFGILLNRLTSRADIETLKWWIVAVVVVGGIVPILYSFRYFIERKNWYSINKCFDLLVVLVGNGGHLLESEGALEKLAAVQATAQNEMTFEEGAAVAKNLQSFIFCHGRGD